jgi:hypothetical protein
MAMPILKAIPDKEKMIDFYVVEPMVVLFKVE